MSLSNFTPKGKAGSVYLLKSGEYYKIGLTTGTVKQRISSMQTGNPVKIKLVASFETEDVVGDEAYLHNKFGSYRVQGEWFSFPQELIDCKDVWFKSCLSESLQPQVVKSHPVVAEPKPKPVKPSALKPVESVKPKPAIPADFNITDDDVQRIMAVTEENCRKVHEANHRNTLDALLAWAKTEMTPEEYAKVECQG